MSDTNKHDKKPRSPKPRASFRQSGNPVSRGPYGKLASAPERRYGRPAPSQPGEREQQPMRRYGRPAPSQPGEREQQPMRRYDRPAPSQPGEREQQPVRRYGRPAPSQPGEREQQPMRRYGRSAPPQQRQERETVLSQDARRAALLVLNRVLQDGAYASLSLDEIFTNMRLSQKDKRLAAVIVYKTIEDLIKLDYVLDQFLQDAQALNGKIRNILRLSACQILLMDKIPDFAVVNEAVELARASGFEDMTGLVNGVLRSLIRQKDTLVWPAPEDPNYLSVTHSIPQWLLDVFLASYPEDTALQIIAYRNPDHATVVRRNRILVRREEFDALLRRKAWEISPGMLEGAYRIKGASEIGRDLDFQGGKFSIQSEGSMAAVLALAPTPGMTVLDCCAAPGGKACLIAEMMQNTGRVYAWDIHEHRVNLIYAQAERLRLYNIRPAVRDAAVYQERFEGTMDAVLLDAPCSGTGVMDNKPDIKYRLTKEGLDELVALQSDLLETVSRYVKPGGTLVYATCSLLPAENEAQITSFLSRHTDFAMDELPAGFPDAFRPHLHTNGLQLLPHRDGVDGFFIARMKKAQHD